MQPDDDDEERWSEAEFFEDESDYEHDNVDYDETGETDETHSSEPRSIDETHEAASPVSSRRRAWILLLIVLILGVAAIGVLIATRPIPPLPPTMKPPWMV